MSAVPSAGARAGAHEGSQRVEPESAAGVPQRRVQQLEAQVAAQAAELHKLRLAARNAEADARAAREVVKRLGHDLRTPLAAILAWTAVLEQHKPDASLLHDGLEAIKRNGRQQAHLIDSGLARVRLDTAARNPTGPDEMGRASRPSPSAPAALAHRGSAPDDDPHDAIRLDAIKVLLVDDDADLREAVGRALRLAGAVVFTASEAPEALTLLRIERPEVLVCDIEMPHVDGHELLSRIRKLAPSAGGAIPALALSGLDSAEDVESSVNAGFARHIGKTKGTFALLAAIQELSRAVSSKEGETRNLV